MVFRLPVMFFTRSTIPRKGGCSSEKVTPLVTTSVPWAEDSPLKIPPVAMNIAFTYQGLKHLDIPDDTLHGFPDEFAMGMKARRDIIGDTGPNHYKHWDPVWNDPDDEFMAERPYPDWN